MRKINRKARAYLLIMGSAHDLGGAYSQRQAAKRASRKLRRGHWLLKVQP